MKVHTNYGVSESFSFPNQRVSNSEKEKAEWYANCCDFVIAQGLNIRNQEELELKYDILKGNIPDKYYEKILNPYNATESKFTKFPAVMRNYDLLKGVVRRYLGEYMKRPHDFMVSAANPEIIFAKNQKLKEEVSAAVEAKVIEQIEINMQQYIKANGSADGFDPTSNFDIESFIEDFNEKYIDDISIQGQNLLSVIQKITDDVIIYTRAYHDFICFGEAYTYSEVVGENLIKRVVPIRDAFPVPNNEMFAEDYDMFAERRMLSYQQIMDEFDEHLSNKDKEFLGDWYSNKTSALESLTFDKYNYYSENGCSKFTQAERELFQKEPIMMRDINSDLYEVWHAVWRGEIKRTVVTYVNEISIVSTRIEDGDYKFNKANGDIKIEHIYEPQVYESVRIGTRRDAVYPYKARVISYNRNGKLPYNGLCELLPGFGKFSIIDIVTPYQIFYNIVSYHREIALAKNKLNILMIAKSLLGKVPEATIHRMVADGVLYIDDDSDHNMLKAQQVRMLASSMGDYIQQLSALLEDIKNKANEQVDMTPQRYGDIANYAGKGTTSQAIVQGSMGSVIIESMMDFIRERDYRRDLDYTKFAWIDGLNTSYRDKDNKLRYISLDVESHMLADYIIVAQSSAKDNEKFEQIKQFAFSAAQNGNYDLAVAAIMADNVSAAKDIMNKLSDANQKNQEAMKQMDAQIAQMEQEFELKKIQLKGEEDRKTEELKGVLDREIEIIRARANIASFSGQITSDTANESADAIKREELDIERDKIDIQRQKIISDDKNKAADRDIKNREISARANNAR